MLAEDGLVDGDVLAAAVDHAAYGGRRDSVQSRLQDGWWQGWRCCTGRWGKWRRCCGMRMGGKGSLIDGDVLTRGANHAWHSLSETRPVKSGKSGGRRWQSSVRHGMMHSWRWRNHGKHGHGGWWVALASRSRSDIVTSINRPVTQVGHEGLSIRYELCSEASRRRRHASIGVRRIWHHVQA
jgi:hypothetical protein